MGFQKYQSRPVERIAYEIQDEDVLWTTGNESEWAVTVGGDRIAFKAHQDPVPGDYVVYLNESDVYHCSREVFRDRNIVEE